MTEKTTLINGVNLANASISQLAKIIADDWKNPYYGATPYIGAMRELSNITDRYGVEDGRSIVLYFTCNANAWRGDVAKAVKAELKKRLK